MKLIFHFSLLGLIFCNPVKGDIRDFCAKCITSTCDKSKIIRDLFQWSLKECTQIQNQKANNQHKTSHPQSQLIHPNPKVLARVQ